MLGNNAPVVGASAGAAGSRRQRRWRYDCSSIFELKKIQWVRLGGGEEWTGWANHPSIHASAVSLLTPIRACPVVGDWDLGLERGNEERGEGTWNGPGLSAGAGQLSKSVGTYVLCTIT